MEIHIWKRGLDPLAPREWGCRVSLLDAPRRPPSSLVWSPDRQQLLGWLPSSVGRRLWLWSLDDRCRLRPHAFVSSRLAPELINLEACRLLSPNGRCLVVPESLHSLQFWHQDEHGGWQPGTRLHTPPDVGVAADQWLRYVRLSGNGQILVRATEKEVAIWQQSGTAPWQRMVQCRVASADESLPKSGRLSDTGLFWVARPGWNTCVWIHGPDTRGRLVRETGIDVRFPVQCLFSSFDGLSQVLLDNRGHALFVHAEHRSDAGGRRSDGPGVQH